jgi:hypothetical protein
LVERTATSDAVGCAGCHSGSRLSDGTSYDVGTGGQLPSAIEVRFPSAQISP